MLKLFSFHRIALWWKIFRMKANEKRLFNLISKQNINHLDKMYIDFCENIKQYPEGSQGYKDLVDMHKDVVTNQIFSLDVRDNIEIAEFIQSVICVLSARIVHLHVKTQKEWTTEVDNILPQEVKQLIDNAPSSQYLITIKLCHDGLLKFMLAQYMAYLLIQYGPTK
jgi:hypothetical protein